MNIENELKETQRKQKEIAEEINQLEQRKQGLVRELLMLAGEIRALERIKEDETTAKG